MSKKSKENQPSEPKVIYNRKARYEYELIDSWEAGIVLVGSEVKSIYKGRVNMVDAYCREINDELWVLELDIEPYDHSSAFTPERRRNRKLLLHKKEIEAIVRRSMEKGLTIIPTKLYFKGGRVKLEVCLGRGKRQYDKRESIAKEDTRREVERVRSEKF